MQEITLKQYEQENLKKIVAPDTEIKNWLVEYTGEKLNLEEGSEIDLEMIVEAVSLEFPEFMLAIAEENWVRGYQQALVDVDTGTKIVDNNVG